MEVLQNRVDSRRAMHQFYVDIFREIDGVEVFTEPNSNFYSNHWLSAIVIDPETTGLTREDLRLAFLEDNIESRPLWKPMHMQPVFATAPFMIQRLQKNFLRMGYVCLPAQVLMT